MKNKKILHYAIALWVPLQLSSLMVISYIAKNTLDTLLKKRLGMVFMLLCGGFPSAVLLVDFVLIVISIIFTVNKNIKTWYGIALIVLDLALYINLLLRNF
jgi:hypothetical protein